TRSGETTKPEPVMMRSHDSARPVILMTLPAAARTSGSRCSRLFGGSTATIGSASHGATTWGNPPESTTSPNARRTVDGETGIARWTSPRMLDSRTPGEAYGTAADEIASPHAHAATSRPATPRAAPPAASKRRAGRADTFERTHPPAHDNTPCPIEATPRLCSMASTETHHPGSNPPSTVGTRNSAADAPPTKPMNDNKPTTKPCVQPV